MVVGVADSGSDHIPINEHSLLFGFMALPWDQLRITYDMELMYADNAFVRLSPRQWLAALALFALVIALTPWIWQHVERFDIGPDYRVPYDLSKDYWLYGRRLRQVVGPEKVIVLGDSVVWGEYVAPDGTLSHFLDRATGSTNRFINGGLNGLFPLAQEGLVTWYGKPLRHRNAAVPVEPLRGNVAAEEFARPVLGEHLHLLGAADRHGELHHRSPRPPSGTVTTILSACRLDASRSRILPVTEGGTAW